jgi:Domain of unknown function (DUF4276)
VRRLIVVVEGQTEEAFVNQVLSPALANNALYVSATRITTSRTAHKVYKGGFVNFSHLERDVQRLIAQDQGCYVSTMVDFYRLPSSVPGYAAAMLLTTPYAKVNVLHSHFRAHFQNSPRFLPYVQLHEFEALLYAKPAEADLVTGSDRLSSMMTAAVTASGGNPEMVNETPQGAPSKRILAAYPGYEKVLHGVQIAGRVGLQNMLNQCNHFKSWHDQLVALPVI